MPPDDQEVSMRKYLVPLLCLGALAIPAAALGQDDPPADPVPPEFAPPAPAPVVDVDSANAFAKLYVARNARDILRIDRRRVIVRDVQSSCLQSPILDTRFGCVFTLKALVIQRRHGWDWGRDSRAHSAGKRGDHRRHNRRFRVRSFGCLGFLRIDGGPTATPTATVVNVECARIPREDRDVIAPVDN
jgi:hypothetical protein